MFLCEHNKLTSLVQTIRVVHAGDVSSTSSLHRHFSTLFSRFSRLKSRVFQDSHIFQRLSATITARILQHCEEYHNNYKCAKTDYTLFVNLFSTVSKVFLTLHELVKKKTFFAALSDIFSQKKSRTTIAHFQDFSRVLNQDSFPGLSNA